jgi:hypothetical protein
MRKRKTSSVDFRHRQDEGSESRTDCFILDSRVAIVALMVMKYIILIPWGCRQEGMCRLLPVGKTRFIPDSLVGGIDGCELTRYIV